jgi:hypothetical protein
LPGGHEDFNIVTTLNERPRQPKRAASHCFIWMESKGADHGDSHSVFYHEFSNLSNVLYPAAVLKFGFAKMDLPE